MMSNETLHELGYEQQKRVETVVETLNTLATRGKDVAEVAHDARNMVSALELYCDLLQEPGVLAPSFEHYSAELRLVAAASRRLVDRLMEYPAKAAETGIVAQPDLASSIKHSNQRLHWKNVQVRQIASLAQELLANRNLLAALAGPTIALTIDVQGGALPVNMTSEDLTRILVNLAKNATEAMSGVGRIHITLWESCGDAADCPWLTLNVEDNGPGLSEAVLQSIFEPNPSMRAARPEGAEWPLRHRGLGLSITRSVVEAAGGAIHAANRDPVGACFQIELPVRTLQHVHSSAV